MIDNNTTDQQDAFANLSENAPMKDYSASEILDLGYNDDYVQRIDADYLNMLDEITPKVNQYTGSRQVKNNNLAVPEAPKQEIPDVVDNSFFLSGLGNTSKGEVYKPEQVYVEPVKGYSIRETNFDRYYNHPKFAELGFHPYRDNEKIYNENSTWGDDWSRMSGQFMANMLPAFSPFGIFDFNMDPDTDGASKMQDAMRIGTSSKEGFGASFTNFSLNSAYTVGIISTIAVEEAALWAATAALTAAAPATGGASGVAAAGTAAIAAERLASNVSKLRNVNKWAGRFADATKLGRGVKASASMLQALKNGDKAKDFWNGLSTGESVLGRVFAPETMRALRTFESTKDVGNGVYKLGKRATAFGGFYRDIRAINLALDESRLEAGFAYNELIANGVAVEKEKSPNGELTDDQLKLINENAIKGAHTSIMANAPILYLSNRIVLGSALGGINPGLKKIFGDQLGSLGNEVLQKTKKVIDKTGKRTTDVFEKKLKVYTPKGIAQRVKSYTVGGSAIAGAHGALRFFSANLGEGVQELYQEALSHGITEYYTEMLRDPAQDSKQLMDAVFEESIKSQMNMQGFETFMSGFMMGGPMSVFSKVIFEGGPGLFNRVFNSEKSKEAKIERDNAIEKLVNIRNEAWNKAGKMESVFDKSNLNFIKVRQAAANQNRSAYEFDQFGFQDNKDFVEFQHLHHLISTGSVDPLKEQLKAFTNLSDEELVEAFPEYEKDVKSGKLRQRLENFYSKAEVMETEFNSLNDAVKNPYHPEKFKKTDRRHIDELSKYEAFEHAKYLRMFTSQAFNDSVKRMANISSELAADDLVYTKENGAAIKISKMSSSDLRILLDPETLRQELAILEQEIRTGNEIKSDEKLLANKKEKFKILSKYYKTITASENQTKTKKKEGGTKFDSRKINKLTSIFKAYAEHLAGVNNAYVDKSKLNSTLKKIVDYGELQYRTKMYDKASEILADPKVLDEIVERTSDYMKNKFAEDRIKLKESIKRAADKQLIADVLKELDNLNIVPDPDEVADFIATGNIESLTIFNDENGRLSILDNSEKFMELNRIFNTYRKLTTPEEETTEEAETSGAEGFDPNDILNSDTENNTDNIINNDNNENPYAKQILRKKYTEYVANKLQENKPFLSDVEWFKSKEALSIANALNKLKALWVDELNPSMADRDDVIKNDKGFGSWIQDNQDNPDVRDIINESDLSFSFLAGDTQSSQPLSSNMERVDEKNDIRFVKVKTNNGVFYAITDLNNQPLTDSYYKQAGITDIKSSYSTLSEGKVIFNKLIKAIPDSGVFEFAGNSMQYGSIVTNNKNRKFVVLGTPEKVKKGGKLFILPFDEIDKYDTTSKKEKAAIRLSPTEFNTQYKVQDVTFKDESVNENTARVINKNITGLYPMGINRQKGVEIIDMLLKNLTPEQLNELSVTVTKNLNPVKKIGFFKVAGKLDNKLISTNTESHTFRISISDSITAIKINKKLADLGYDSLDNLDILLPSGNLTFADGNPFNFTDEQADKYFAFKNQALRALAKQELLREKLLEKLGNANEVTVKLSDIVGDLSVSYEFAEVIENYSNSLNELEHSTYDGEIVIIDNFTRYDESTGQRNRALNYITNYSPDSVEAKTLRDKVEEELSSTNQLSGKNLIDYLKTERSFDRYHAVIKLPNGKIIFAPLKSNPITVEKQEEIYTKLLDRAAVTRENNLTEEGVAKKKTYNDEFNDEINNEFYISLKGGFKGELRVTPKGDIIIRYLDVENDTLLNTTFFANEKTQGEFKSFDDLVKALDVMTNHSNSPDTNELGFKLTTDSFKTSFPETTFANGIVENTATNLDSKLIKNLNLEFNFENNEVNDYIASKKIADQVDNSIDTDSFDKWSEIINKATPNELDAIVDQIDKAGEMMPNLMDMIAIKREGFKNSIQPEQQTNEVEAKKDEIERRREEELKPYSYTLAEVNKMPSGILRNFLMQVNQAINNIKINGGQELLDYLNNNRSSIYDKTAEDNRFKKKQNTIIAADAIDAGIAPNWKLTDLRQAIKLYNSLLSNKEEINAKYDAELDALESVQQAGEVGTLEEELKQAKAALTIYRKALEAKKDSGEITGAEYIKATAMKQDAEFAKLSGKVSELERRINSAYGFKVVSDDFKRSDVESIDNFIAWAKKNLPAFVQINDIKDVADRLKVKGIPIGLFAMHLNNISGGVNVGGTVYVGEKGFRYHEAFHAVFRLLLSDAEITKYLTIAKKEVRAKLRKEGKNFRLELQKFRNTTEAYKNMSEERLEQEYLEEYLADEFEKFKTDPKSSKADGVIKNLFNRLVEWIKTVFSNYTKNELRNLFEKIDAGKYRSAGSIENRFTQSFKNGVTNEAYKLLSYEKIKLDRGYANKYLDPSTTDLLIKQITSSYLERVKKIVPGQSREDVLIETIQDFQAYHDPFAEKNINQDGANITKLINRYKALGGVIDGSSAEEIASAEEFMQKTMDVVLEYISLFDQKIQNEKYLTDSFEENEGLRNVSDWDKDQSMIGGFSSLPMALRAYIGTTSLLSSENTFGNLLPSGRKLYVPVDFISAYNGLLKAVKNSTDEVTFLRSLISFSKGNKQTKSVVDRILNDIGVEEEIILNGKSGDVLKSIKNTSLFMEIFKGFENFKVDYLFVHTNTDSASTSSNSKVLLYNAANRDDTNSQIDVWKQSYSELYNELKGNSKLLNKATDSLIALSGFLDNLGTKMSDKDIDKKAQELSDDIYNNLGIRLSPAYIAFSIVSNLTDVSTSIYQQTILENNKNIEPISSEAIVEIANQIKISEGSNKMSGYLFSKKGTGVRSRLLKLAKGNAMFDELIGQTVFLNPEGNFVYAHQMGTLHLKRIYGLNDASNLDKIKRKDNNYNATNILLNSPAFLAMSKQDQIKVLRVAGTKESKLTETNESVLEENAGISLDKNGKTYGGLTRAEFTAMNINAYLANYQQLSQQNKKIEFIDPNTGETIETTLAPVLIRVLEASNTGDMVPLPIIKTVEFDDKGSVKLTDKALNLFVEEINREFQRIQREAAIPRDQRIPIDGYNAVNGALTFKNEGRAFEFADSAYLLSNKNNLSNQLEAKDPRFNDSVADRVVKQKQKFVHVGAKAAMNIGLTRQGTSSRTPVKVTSKNTTKLFNIKSLGEIQVDENNIKNIIESMGDGVSKNKTKNFTYPVQVGDVTFYVENKVTRDFLNGDVKRYGYELTDPNTKQTSKIESPAPQTSEVRSIPMQSDNASKILSGEKTTTLRTNNLPSGIYNIGGQQFNLTNRGLLSIEEAGGVEAINKSEAFAQSGPKFSSTKDFLAGKRKLYVYDITPAQPTEQTSGVEMFNGLPVINSNKIVNSEGKKGAAKFNKGQILVDRAFLKIKFKEKTWTNMRELVEGLDGEKIISRAENLPEDQFKTYEEFEEFVLTHEYLHFAYPRKEFLKDVPGSTKGAYETEINRRALESIESLKALQAAEEAMAEEMMAESEAKETLDLKTLLETIAKENPNVTLEQALKDDRINMTMSEFKDRLQGKLISDYTNFALELESGKIQTKISSDIIDGFTNDEGLENGEKAMEELNLVRNNQDYNLMQIYFNNWLNTKAINQLILGDQSKSLKDPIDKVKRAKLNNASYISAGSKLFDKSKGVNHATKDILGVLFTDPEFERVYAGGKGERADAQMYITTKALRHMLFGFAKLDNAKASLLDKIEKGEYVDADLFWGYVDNNKNKIEGYKSLGAIFNSLKLVYNDGDTALKMSAVVLTPELTSRVVSKDENGNPIYEAKEQSRKLHNLRLKLEKLQEENPKAIAIAYPQSAAKMMKKNTVDHNVLFDDNLFAEIKPSLLDADYMGLQMENPSNKIEITDPTQLKALITSELNNEQIVYINGEELSLGDIRKKYNTASKNKLNDKYFNKVNLIANFSIETAMRELRNSKETGQLSISLDEFKDFAVESLKASGSSSSIIEFFDKNLNYDLNNTLVQKQFEQLFLSYFAKDTISEKISGDALALMSDFGIRVVRRVFSVDENGVPDRFSVIRDVTYNRNPLPIELRSDEEGNLPGLADLIKDSNGEGVIISDILRHNVKEYDKNGKYTNVRYTEGLRPANSAEASLIEETSASMEDVISKSFVVRIPSQDKHSASSVKFIDFLPVYYGSTAIFSKELIEISGADFDIDKVYVHTKEFYKEAATGKLIEYGVAERSGKKEGFDDYIHYINEKVKSKKSSYSKAFKKYDTSTKNNKQKYTDAELKKAKESKLSIESFKALKLLGLPTTLNEYKSYVEVKGEPYDAALSNQILDYKFAMWGNESNTVESKEGANPIAYDPADIKALTDVWDYIKTNLPELAEEVDGEMGDVDSIYGQSKAFGNNKEGAASIGKIVLPNLFLNFLGEHNISIRDIKIAGQETIPQIKFNGIKFSDFNAKYEKIKTDKGISEGQRTQYIISGLITAMTDNAKERLAAKLGLNKDALNLVGLYSKLGVPIKTSILLVSNPVIKNEYFAANNKTFKNDPGIASRISYLIKQIEKENKGIKTKQVDVTDELLERHIKNNIDLNTANNKELIELYSIVKQFETGHRIKSFINELSSVMNLSKGFGQSFVDVDRTNNSLNQLGLEMSNEEFKKATYKNLPLPVDVRDLLKSDLWQSNLVDVFKHFKNVLLPQVFLTRTPSFVQMKDAILNNLISDEYLIDDDVKNKISNDLLSFLTIKAYMKDLEAKGAMIPLASLSNEMLYPQANSEFNINSLVTSLRKQFPNNYFLQSFIYNENANDLDNVTGIHNVESNTFGKKNDFDKIRVQAAFMEIFGENKIDATHLIHYMMVKDGFQYASGSLIEAVVPAVLDTFSISIENIFDIMKSERYGEIFEKKFGNTYDGLINEFVYGYSKSNKSNIYLNSITGVPFYSALYRKTNISEKEITKETALNNPDKIYVFSENQNQVGTTRSSTVRGLENAKPITLMYDLATYFDVNDLTNFANRLDFEINEILKSGKEVVFPQFLLSDESMKKLKTESPEIFDYLDQKLRSEFGYIIQNKGGGYIALEEGSVKKLSSIENKPAYIVKDKNDTILNVNLKSDPMGLLSRSGFKSKTKIVKGKKLKTLDFPAVIKHLAYQRNAQGVVTSIIPETYELIEVENPYKKEGDYILDRDNLIASGVSAKYRLTESAGSNYQHPNGFMFDTVSFKRPSYNKVKEFVKDEDRGLLDDTFNTEDIAVSNYAKNKIRAQESGFEIEIENGVSYAYVERGRVAINELTESDFTDETVESIVDETDDVLENNEDVYTENVDETQGESFSINDLFGSMEETLEEKYPRIVKWWDNNIQNNPENLSKLAAEQQIANLEQLLKERDDSEQNYETDSEFIDHLKSCIL